MEEKTGWEWKVDHYQGGTIRKMTEKEFLYYVGSLPFGKECIGKTMLYKRVYDNFKGF